MEELLKLLDRPIAFQRAFVKLTKSVSAALMLSQAVYWSRRTSKEDGWFYKSATEWTEETGLSRHEQDSARKILKKTSFWKEKLAGVPATVNFRIDNLALLSSLTESSKLDSKDSQFAGKRQTSMPESGKHSITETTTETTTAEHSSASQESLFGVESPVVKKKKTVKEKAEAFPEFKPFVQIWTEQYPELGFDGLSGKKINSMIITCRDIALQRGAERGNHEKVIGVFAYIMAYMKREGHWCHGKKIATVDSHLREIYYEIKNGKQQKTIGSRPSAGSIINSFRQG